MIEVEICTENEIRDDVYGMIGAAVDSLSWVIPGHIALDDVANEICSELDLNLAKAIDDVQHASIEVVASALINMALTERILAEVLEEIREAWVEVHSAPKPHGL